MSGRSRRTASHIEDVVREKYGSVATSGLSSAHEGVKAVAEAFGYSPEELRSIPAAANMGLSCGDPTATANLERATWVFYRIRPERLDAIRATLSTSGVGTPRRARRA